MTTVLFPTLIRYIPGANKKNAKRNIKHLLKQAGIIEKPIRYKNQDGDGWYGWVANNITILVPGLPLEDLTDPLSPRFYIDGNSWTLEFAIRILREIIRNKE